MVIVMGMPIGYRSRREPQREIRRIIQFTAHTGSTLGRERKFRRSNRLCAAGCRSRTGPALTMRCSMPPKLQTSKIPYGARGRIARRPAAEVSSACRMAQPQALWDKTAGAS